MSQTNAASRTFFARANDIHCRDFSARLMRFARARLRRACGFGLQLADDPRVATAWKHRWEGEHYVRLLRWRDEGFRPRVIYDIGAHEGRWAEMAQFVFSPEAIVLFEPQRAFQEKAMFRQPTGEARWTMVPVALGDKEATGRLYVTENSAASSLLQPAQEGGTPGMAPVRDESIQVVALDQVASSRQLRLPDLVKIDVQGYEHLVLAGGRETIAQARHIVIEVSLQELYRGQPLLPEVLHLLGALGFSLVDLHEGTRLWPAPPVQWDLWLKRGK